MIFFKSRAYRGATIGSTALGSKDAFPKALVWGPSYSLLQITLDYILWMVFQTRKSWEQIMNRALNRYASHPSILYEKGRWKRFKQNLFQQSAKPETKQRTKDIRPLFENSYLPLLFTILKFDKESFILHKLKCTNLFQEVEAVSAVGGQRWWFTIQW